jgi:hypothetical protein
MDFAVLSNFYRYLLAVGEDERGITWTYGDFAELTLQDCQFHGGVLNLTPGETESTGTVRLRNNLFERVRNLISLVERDTPVEVANNLFKAGNLLIGSTEVNSWDLRDNLFERCGIEPLTPWELANDYNGYYLEAGQQRLVPNGTHDKVLTSAPIFQTSTLGGYYYPTSSPLYNAGSRTPDEAGLYHHTTQTIQKKDGEETGTPNKVNIGFHYAALQPGSVPKDTDADGLPDYFEDKNGNNTLDTEETSLTLGDTDGDAVTDSREEMYVDTDIDSDGLTTNAELFLGTNPLLSDNPLVLNPVTAGEEPYALAFTVPLTTDVVGNRGVLTLTMDGQPADGHEIERNVDGSYTVKWNTIFSPSGAHHVQLRLQPNSVSLPKDVGQSPVNFAGGPIYSLQVSNIVRFKTFYSSFSDQLWVYGKLEVPEASYEVKIFDAQHHLVKTLPGYTDTGVIEESWDLTETPGGPQRQDASFRAEVVITPPNCDQNLWHSCSTPYPVNFFRSFNWGGDAFTMSYSWHDYTWSLMRETMYRQNVVDIVFNPGLENEYLNTFLNSFNGTVFRMHTPFDASVLLDDLAASGVRNFFFSGHGSPSQISASVADGGSLAPRDIGDALGNQYGRKGWERREHPYRLVIINSCESAAGNLFAKAFGIEPSTLTQADLIRRPEAEQAFVGWPSYIYLPNFANGIVDYGPTLWLLFTLWMEEFPLDECMQAASDRGLYFPLDRNYVIYGYPQLKRSPSNQP